MKKTIYQALALIFVSQVSFLTVACDPVGSDDRYIEMEEVTSDRVVLLEEFTGQNCVNCPSAHRIIEDLQEQYGQSLISVSIHAGKFAYAEGRYEPKYQTFKTPEGDTYAEQWNVQEYPSGIVNRSGGIQLPEAWAASVYRELMRPATVAMDIEACVTEDGKIDVQTTLVPGEAMEAMLQLWVVEDSIVSFQDMKDSPRILDYKHNNVYRASINGVGGEPVTLQHSEPLALSHSIDLRERWDVQHLRVVGFVYNKQEVVQACQADVK